MKYFVNHSVLGKYNITNEANEVKYNVKRSLIGFKLDLYCGKVLVGYVEKDVLNVGKYNIICKGNNIGYIRADVSSVSVKLDSKWYTTKTKKKADFDIRDYGKIVASVKDAATLKAKYEIDITQGYNEIEVLLLILALDSINFEVR